MKRFNLSKVVGTSLLAASLAVLPISLPAAAQTGTDTNRTEDNTRPTVDTTPFQETRDGNNNWGWLGLIGLVGLANLFRKQKEPARYAEPGAADRTGPKY